MLKHSRPLSSFTVATLVTTALSMSALAQEVVVHPQPFSGPLRNPLMGFRPGLPNYLDKPNEDPYATVLRQYIKWNEIENSESDGIEKIRAYCEGTWKGLPELGVKVVPRVYLRYTKDEQSYWPADMTTGDYTSEQYKQRCLRLIGRLGQLWDNDPRVAWVQMGLIGRWGEQHTPRPTDEQRKWLTDAFKAAFPHKQVLIRFPENFKDTGFGVYWDSFGGNGELYNVNQWIPKNAIHDGEIAYDFARADPFGTSPDQTVGTPIYRANLIDKIRQTNELTLGWVSDYNKNDPNLAVGAAELQSQFGYRFVLEELRYQAHVSPGDRLPVSFTVRNIGPAFFPYQWPVELSLLDPKTHDPVLKQIVSSADVRTWAPGQKWIIQAHRYETPAPLTSVRDEFILPKDFKLGQYVLALSILDPAGNRPAVRFATINYWKGGRQPVGMVNVGSGGRISEIDPATFTDPNSERSSYALSTP